MKRKETIKLAFTILLLFGTIAGTLLAQKVQNIQKKASGPPSTPGCNEIKNRYPNCISTSRSFGENIKNGTLCISKIDPSAVSYLLCCKNGYIARNNKGENECIAQSVGDGGGPQPLPTDIPTSPPPTGGGGGGSGGGGTKPTPTTPPVVSGCPAGGSACTGGGAWCAGPSRDSGGCPPSYTMVANSWCSNGYCCCPPGGEGGGGGGGGGTQPTTPPSSTGKATPRPTPIESDSNQPKITIVFRQQGITSTVKSGISSQLKTYIVLKNSQNTYRIEKVTPSVANGKWIAAFSKDDSGKTIPAGVYSLSIKGNSHLRKKFEGVEIGNENVTIDKSTKDEEQLKAGDVNGDNTITIEDQSIVLKYYTDFRVKVKPSNSEMINADINKDGYITIDDVALVALNWSNISVPGDNE